MHQDNFLRRYFRRVIYQRFPRSVRAELKALELAGDSLRRLLRIQVTSSLSSPSQNSRRRFGISVTDEKIE